MTSQDPRLMCLALLSLSLATPAWAQTPPPADPPPEENPLFSNDPNNGTRNPPKEKPKDEPKTTQPAPARAQGEVLPKGPRYRDFGCGPDRRDRRYVGYYFICVDVRGGRIAYADIIPSYGKPLLPNKPILVKVIHESTQRVSIESEGQLGLFAPGDRKSVV